MYSLWQTRRDKYEGVKPFKDGVIIRHCCVIDLIGILNDGYKLNKAIMGLLKRRERRAWKETKIFRRSSWSVLTLNRQPKWKGGWQGSSATAALFRGAGKHRCSEAVLG